MKQKNHSNIAGRLGRWLLITPLARLTQLMRSRARWTVVAVVGLIAAIVACQLTWKQIGPAVRGSEHYRVRADDLALSTQPPWISAEVNVRAEVVRDASLEGEMSLLDEGLTERIAKAFAMHPWIERVERVTKRFPARVDVQVVWRKPVCMVEVDSRLEPVDQQGVLLPSGDFPPKIARRYPRVQGIQTAPIGQVGAPWGDPRVSGAARVAAALQDVWYELGLSHVTASRSPSESASGYDYTYDLYTRGGTRIHWGFSPEADMAGEPSALDKVARLLAHADEHGSLDRGVGRSPWNLGSSGPLSSLPGASGVQ